MCRVCVCTGERKRKILCSRESDRVVVSDQRCHGTARPSVVTEPCNTDCELRSVSFVKPAYSANMEQLTSCFQDLPYVSVSS